MLGGVAKDAALQSWREIDEAREVDGKALGSGASSAAHRTASENQLRREAGDLGLPPGFFIPCQVGHVGEVLAEGGVPGFEQRQQLLADAVAREGKVTVGRVFAPDLVAFAQVGFDFGAGGAEKGAKDRATALRGLELRMNARKTLGPCAAEELGENGFGLIVEGVRGCHCIDDCVGRTIEHELTEPRVPKATCGFFDGFAVRLGLGSGVDASVVKWNVELLSEVTGEGQVGIGFVAAETVMEMGGVEDEAQFPARFTIPLDEDTQEGDGVGAAREADGESHAGAQ